MNALHRSILILALLGVAAVLLFFAAFRDRRPAIFFAAESGNTNGIAKYLHAGNDVNGPIICYRYGGRYAPLLGIATANGRKEALELLLRKGANPNQPDSRGETPLMLVGQIQDSETRIQILKVLLDAGADPKLKASSTYNNTPLIRAASRGQSDVVSALLTAGADVNATNTVGETSLHVADNAEVAQLLIGAGGNTAMRTVWGETPAETAARRQKADVLTVLTNAPP